MRRSSLSMLCRLSHKTCSSTGVVPWERIDRLLANHLKPRIVTYREDTISRRWQFRASFPGTPNGDR